MADSKLTLLITANDQATKELERMQRSGKRMADNFKKYGAVLTAAGAAMTYALGMAAKAAAEEEAGIVRLSTAMKNVGISYDATSDSLEAWIDKQQQLTAFADSEQRDALASLIRITRDTSEAQDLLTLAMDVAIGTGRDLASANTLIMYALSGNWGMLERYIPAIKQAQSEEEKWLMLRKLFAGQAEAFGQSTAGQMKTLENNISDLKESIGSFIASAVQPVVAWLNNFVQMLKSIPEPIQKVIAYIGMGGAGALTLTGVFLMLLGFLPQIFAGFTVLRTILLTKLIPAIISTTAALWAKVTALLAVLAASGPAGWVVLAASIALIGTAAAAGAMQINSLMKSLEENKEATEENAKAVDYTRQKLTNYAEYGIDVLQRVQQKQEDINTELEREIRLRESIKKNMSAYAMLLSKANIGEIDYETLAKSLPGYEKFHGENARTVTVPAYASGGPINEPTLLYGMSSRRVYAVAGEAGPERVEPGRSSGRPVNIILEIGDAVYQYVVENLNNDVRIRA